MIDLSARRGATPMEGDASRFDADVEPDRLFGISESLWRQVVDKTGGNADVGQNE
ncbi:MAG: hypothetical protein J4G15_00370 [Alphaproteobacteria bacterium]|nr:hypothetical protein [Alphaproteobacteria bacterium]